MTVTFEPLTESHFPFLLKWLEAPHVKAWWDQDVKWTPELIQEKYGNYVKGHKRLKLKDQVIEKPMHAFIISLDDTPIGYIQIYNAYDFPRAKPLMGLPEKLAAFDILIGEQNYLAKGIGSQALRQFLDNFCDNSYTHVFADPDIDNKAAIKTYENAGFKRGTEDADTGKVWMLKEQPRCIL